MNAQRDSTLAAIAAIFVLFTAMLDPRLSSGVAVCLLILFAIYKLIDDRGQPSQS
jgi:hypothetical protein